MGHRLNINILEKENNTSIYLHWGAMPSTINKLSKLNFKEHESTPNIFLGKIMFAYNEDEKEGNDLLKKVMQLLKMDNDNVKSFDSALTDENQTLKDFIEQDVKKKQLTEWDKAIKQVMEKLPKNKFYSLDILKTELKLILKWNAQELKEWVDEIDLWNETYYFEGNVMAGGFYNDYGRYVFLGESKQFILTEDWEKDGYKYSS